ncbi:MAG TPA: tail fiber domain-containing protein [Candidatus Udaeobacter sp.]|nr:tail fiber domain-containing protein [Candidatus Udaeobacter sp.]
MTTLHFRKSINRLPFRRGLLLIPLALACFALAPAARAVLPPPTPDGGYPNGNTAEGSGALFSLTTGTNNTANGDTALNHNTTGYNNTAIGNTALYNNTGGYKNTATGHNSLLTNTTGNYNTATGAGSLKFNTIGTYNTANGQGALNSNTSGLGNTADGAGALFHNTTGRLNIVLGAAAGQNLTTGSNNIDISNPGVAAESNIIRIGNEVAFTDLVGIVHPAHTKTFIAGIHGATASGAVTVYVNSSGQLGTLPSSARFKHDIHGMDKASEVILALKPVTFHYKAEIDPKGIPQFGLVAEEVEKVNPDLVTRDAKGEVYTVRYEAVNAMLLNEFLKEHRKVEQQEATITQVKSTAAKQEATIARQQKQIEALTTGLQKVSDQLELSKTAPRTVGNNQ